MVNMSRLPRIDDIAASALQITFVLLIVTCVIAIAPFLALSFHANPSGDDFCFASEFRGVGLFNLIYQWYWTFNGSYSSLALQGAFYIYADVTEHYKALSFLLFFSTWAAMVFFISVLVCSKRITLPNCLAGLVFLLAYIILMDRVVDNFYWLNAGIAYQLANVFILCLLCMVMLLYRRLDAERAATGLIFGTALAIFLMMGMTELFLILGVTLILAAYIWSLLEGNTSSRVWLLLLALAIVCAAVVAGSPGNGARMDAAYPSAGQVSQALSGAWGFGWIQMKRILSEPVFWLGSAAWCFYLSAIYPHEECPHRPRPFLIVMVGFGCFLVLFVVFAPFWYATDMSPYERIVNEGVFVFLTMWVSFISLLIRRFLFWGRIGLAVWPRGAVQKLVYLTLLIGLGWHLVSNEVIQTAREDLVVKAPHYEEVYKERFRIAHDAQSRGLTSIRVPPMILDRPTTIFYIPVTDDPNDFGNQCFAGYFGQHEVRAY